MGIDLGRVLDVLPVMVWTSRPDGRIDFANRGWSEYTGLAFENDSDLMWQTTTHPASLASLLDRWNLLLASGEPGEIEVHIRRFDGRYRRFLIQCNPVSDDAGTVVRWSFLATDIDDRWGERTSRSVIDGIPGLIATLDPTGVIEFVNRQLVDYTGQRLEELKRWGTNGTVHPEDLPNVADIFLKAIADGSPFEIELRLRRSDGEYRWFSNRGTPSYGESGLIVRWHVLLVDTHEQRQAAEALRERERETRLIVDRIPAGVEVLTSGGEIMAVNDHIVRYFGMSEQELKRRGLAELIHPDDLQAVLDTASKSLATGEPYLAEQRFLGADGSYRWFQVRGLPLRDRDGRIIRWYALHIDIDERKRTEEALSKSEGYVRLIVDSIPGMIAVFAPSGELELVSQQVLAFYGKTFDELKRWATGDSTHPDDLPHAIERFTHALTSGEAFDFEIRTRRFDGVYRWFQSRGLPLRDASGRIVRWYNLLIDIDERKRAEEALAASERNLKLTIDTIPAMVWSANTDGVADFFNQFYLDYLGRPLEKTLGWGWADAVHPDDIGKLSEVWQATLTRGTLGECEARMRRFDGAYRWFLYRVNPLHDGEGNIARWHGINIDIDDRKRAEDELRRSEAFLAEGQHLARMGNFSWHVESGRLIWSEPLYRIFEFDPEIVIALDLIAGRVHPEDLPMMVDMVERAQRGENHFEYQHRIILPDHSIKHLHLVAHRIRDNAAEIEYVGAVLDITQRRLSEEALEKLRADLAQVTRIMSLGVLTASVAHEVNQPLAGIVTNASTCLRMLAADPPNIEVAMETARRTIRDGNRAADVIGRLRTLFSRRQLTIGPVDLNDAVQETIVMSRGDLLRGRAALNTELADGLPAVAGDRIQLQQVIMNLVRNAADAMSDIEHHSRGLLIKTEIAQDDHVRLSVRDEGVGFGAASAEQFFEPFYTTKTDGMGIGLSVSRSIIENHNGRLWAEANDGPGVTVSFSIPLFGDEPPAIPSANAQMGADGGAENTSGLS